MQVVDTITVAELEKMSQTMYDGLVKAVVDLKRGMLIVDAEMHVDEEQYLLEQGSVQSDLWGINLYPGEFGTDQFVEFDSMINIRPRQNNHTRGVEDPALRKSIITLVAGKVKA